MKKKIVCMILGAMVAMSLGACGSTGGTQSAPVDNSAEVVAEAPSLISNVEITNIETEPYLGWVTITVYNGNDVDVDIYANCDDGIHSEDGFAYSVAPNRYDEIVFLEEMTSDAVVTITDVKESW